MAPVSAMRATLSGRVKGELITVDVAAALWDRFRDQKVFMRMNESEMLCWLTNDGRLAATEQLVEEFVTFLETGEADIVSSS